MTSPSECHIQQCNNHLIDLPIVAHGRVWNSKSPWPAISFKADATFQDHPPLIYQGQVPAMPQFLLQRNDALPESRNGVTTTIGTGFLNCCCSCMIVSREAFQRILENTHTINALDCVGARIHVGLMEIIYKTICIRPSISGANTHTDTSVIRPLPLITAAARLRSLVASVHEAVGSTI